jgi:hypothetical protein
MSAPRQTHYDVLGVKRDAKRVDIGRAYNRLRSEMQKEMAAPDKRRAALVQQAHETLSDPVTRDAYDKSLLAPERKRRAALTGSVIVGVALIVAAAYFVFLPPPSSPPPRSAAEILHSASLAVGGLKRLDMSGQSARVGIAFAIDEGVMLTTCQEIAPGSQLVVHLSPRDAPARVATSDEALGLCQLAVEGAGSKPLPVSGVPPRTGDKVYATKINAVGEVALIPGTVKRVSVESGSRVVHASMPVANAGGGGPLLDADGRVIGVASRSQPDDRGRFVAVPEAWIPYPKVSRSAPSESAPRPPEPKAPPAFPSVPKNIEDIPPERREKLEKAFRPPPNVPDDL